MLTSGAASERSLSLRTVTLEVLVSQWAQRCPEVRPGSLSTGRLQP